MEKERKDKKGSGEHKMLLFELDRYNNFLKEKYRMSKLLCYYKLILINY